MLEGGKITSKQMILLLFTSRMITWIAFLFVIFAPPGNQDVWIDCLMALPLQLLLALPFYFLAKRFDKQSFFEYTTAILGKPGKGIGILYILFLIHMSALSIAQFSIFLTTVLMDITPPLFFKITLLILSAFAAYKGIESLGRFTELVAPIGMIVVLGVVLALVKDMDPKEFLPFLESGLFPSFFTGLYIFSTNIELIMMAVLLPFLNHRGKLNTVYIGFPILLVVFLFTLTATVIALFGYDLAKTMTFPFYSAIRTISLGNIIERVESIFVAAWLLGLYVKMALYLYVTVLGISQIFRLKVYRPLLLPLVSLIVPVSTLLGKNIVEMNEFTSFEIYPWYALNFIFIIPFFLLLTAIVRRKGEYRP
ncbi:endospore germination permease [Desulfitobacterium sp. THU1]|uniref:GerAB/ArcD/ProY family transporter n=1 Tax=Desulfitobacterium sp. THU1 TaxID=3138072 RepID=UPI00311F55EE